MKTLKHMYFSTRITKYDTLKEMYINLEMKPFDRHQKKTSDLYSASSLKRQSEGTHVLGGCLKNKTEM